jgi:hypothetical protein
VVAAFQDAFVALAADVQLRRAFARDPDAALRALDVQLDPRARAALAAIDPAALDRYARSLLAKRWSDVARVVPLAERVVPQLGARYRGWLAEHPAPAHDTVLGPGVAEALRALPALRAQLSGDGDTPYAADLYAFEVLRAASCGDGERRALRSRFAIHAIVEDVARKLLPTDPPLAPHDYAFERTRVSWRPAR